MGIFTSIMYFQKLMGVEAFLAHHHAGDVGPPPAWGGIADDGPDAPCAVAGMFGCAPMNSTYDYWKNGVPWEGPPSCSTKSFESSTTMMPEAVCVFRFVLIDLTA